MGQGPVTGRALGFCKGFDTPGYAKGFGGGMGRGRGYGRGRGPGMGRGWNAGGFHRGFFSFFQENPTMSRNDEIRMLKAQAESLSQAQQDIQKRLSELEQQGK
jgi:hypothetical protein